MFEDYFVTCAAAVALREAGFNEPCMAVHEYYKFHGKEYKEFHIAYFGKPGEPRMYSDKIQKLMIKRPGLFIDQRTNQQFPPWLYAAPLYEQVLDWFLSKGLYLHPYNLQGIRTKDMEHKWGVNIFDMEYNHLWPSIPLTKAYTQEMQLFLADGRRLALNNAILPAIKLLPK